MRAFALQPSSRTRPPPDLVLGTRSFPGVFGGRFLSQTTGPSCVTRLLPLANEALAFQLERLLSLQKQDLAAFEPGISLWSMA